MRGGESVTLSKSDGVVVISDMCSIGGSLFEESLGSLISRGWLLTHFTLIHNDSSVFRSSHYNHLMYLPHSLPYQASDTGGPWSDLPGWMGVFSFPSLILGGIKSTVNIFLFFWCLVFLAERAAATQESATHFLRLQTRPSPWLELGPTPSRQA